MTEIERQLELHSLIDTTNKQRSLLLRIIRIFFSLAGCMWIVIWFFPFEIETAKTLFLLRQYQLYLLLLTLWGYDYRRENQRNTLLIHVATNCALPPSSLTLEQIKATGHINYFDVLTKTNWHDKHYFSILFTWGLILASLLYLGLQTYSVFTNMM